MVVAKIRVRVEGNWREEHDHGFAELIGGRNCHVQRRIVSASLRSLHPINHASAF
jgi:hypothetical protein